MPDALPLTGLFGKVPAHGDFVRRGLPTSFVGPWDSWLQDGMATARDRLGDRWATVWDAAPAWRFALPAGACGPDPVAGVMLPSEDMVGRRFPITLAALLPGDAALPAPAWFAALEAAARAGRAGQADADALAAAIPAPDAVIEAMPAAPWPLAEPADPSPLPFAAVAEPAVAAFVDFASDAVPGAPPGDAADVLDLFTGGSPGQGAVESTMPMPPPPVDGPGDVLDMLGGAQVPQAGTTDAASRDVLDMFGAALPAAAPDPAPSDGTLAFLLGEGASPGPALADAAPAVDSADPLAALIAAGDAPLTAAPLHLGAEADEPAPAADASDALAVAGLAPMPAPLSAAEAPDPPPGGGWWTTGGGSRLPPSARAWPALLPAADFASLLEADA